MTPYSTKAEVRKATGFTDDTLILDATIDEKIASADGIINAKIADVYVIPLAVTPDIINEISIQVAKAFLYSSEYGEESQGTDKGWREILDFYMEILKQIADQEIKLLDPTTNEELDRVDLKTPIFSPTAASSEIGERDEPRLTIKQRF